MTDDPLRHQLTELLDGVGAHMSFDEAVAEFPDEAKTALEYGAEGIGLFRSEYMLGRSRRWPFRWPSSVSALPQLPQCESAMQQFNLPLSETGPTFRPTCPIFPGQFDAL